MDTKIVILGESTEIKNLSFTKAYINISKIIITSNFLLKNFNNIDVINIFSKEFKEISEEDKAKINEAKFNNELYDKIQENLKEISSVHLDVDIKNLNFVSALSGGRFNIRLRTESFTITDYFVEKGEILGKIKKLLLEYLDFKGNFLRKEKLNNFQIEIFESDDIYKSIILKKYEDSFILASSFGFPKTNFTIDSLNSPEIYVSKGRDYKFFKSKQEKYYKRDHSKLVESSIKVDKVLSNEDLKLIYEKTKNIKDLILEMYITEKGKLKIVDLDISYESIVEPSSEGFYLYKNNFDINKISLIGLQDDLEKEYPYPLYLLIKNNLEIEEFFNNVTNYLDDKFLPHFDGLIFNENIFSQYLIKIGDEFNLDIIYFSKELSKSTSVEVSKPLNFSNNQLNTDASNINNLFKDENKDELLEKLKKINLELNKKQETQNSFNDSNLINNSISSNQNFNNIVTSGENNLHSFAENFLYSKNKEEKEIEEEDKKMGALDFFAKKALETQKALEKERNNVLTEGNNVNNINSFQSQKAEVKDNRGSSQQSNLSNLNNLSNIFDNFSIDSSSINKSLKEDNLTRSSSTGNLDNLSISSNSVNNNFIEKVNNLSSKEDIIRKELEIEKERLNKILQELNASFSEIKRNNEIVGKFRETINENINNSVKEFSGNFNDINRIKTEIVSRFENVLAISLIGIPEFGELVDKYFVSEYNNFDKESFMLISSKDEIKEDYNINYILPFTEDINENDKYYYLINNTESFFHLNGNAKGYFINISNLNKKTILKFVENLYKKKEELYLILKKEELNILEEIINFVKGIYIIDLASEDDINIVKEKLLKYEKEYMIKLSNKLL